MYQLILFLLISLCSMVQAQQADYRLVWQDEFNYSGLPDSAKWSYDLGDGCPNVCGWGNNELQSYTSGWPASGEIDIMEHVGYEPKRVYATVHTQAFNHIKGTQTTDTLRIDAAEGTFHRYVLEWAPEKITWFVDDRLYSTFKNRNKTYKEWPFDHPFHLILNIAVGGQLGRHQWG